MSDFQHDVAGISALDDDHRRELYLFVSAQPEPVSREQAAKALGVPVHLATFHLERLEDAGLLVSEYVRLTGRSGPGAGRPAKLYRRGSAEISVSLPAREYALAGELMAQAIDDATETGTPIADALSRSARRHGEQIGAAAVVSGSSLQTAVRALRGLGYEPRLEDAHVVMANCPFSALARDHSRLVCGMNLDLLDGMCDHIGGLEAKLEPGRGGCCVVLREAS